MKKWIISLLLAVMFLTMLTSCKSKEVTAPSTVVEQNQSELVKNSETQNPEMQVQETEIAKEETVTESAEPETESRETITIENDPVYVAEAEEIFAWELDAYLVPEEELAEYDTSYLLSNAIIKTTTVTVHEADAAHCRVTINYPDAASVCREAMEQLPEDADDVQIDTAVKDIASAIEQKQVAMLEKEFLLEMNSETEVTSIAWTPEALDAITGNLYSFE
ncbi:MAG: hypothetical protein IKC46_00775 [Lachnospiraceae bacterium]|nr:hypothetical protein [Lachnospiraceae bacterium]